MAEHRSHGEMCASREGEAGGTGVQSNQLHNELKGQCVLRETLTEEGEEEEEKRKEGRVSICSAI